MMLSFLEGLASIMNSSQGAVSDVHEGCMMNLASAINVECLRFRFVQVVVVKDEM